MNTQWKRSVGVVWEELGGEVLLVSPRSGARWLLNATAAAVWKLCDGTRSFAELSDTAACAEVARFCEALENLGLLIRSVEARRRAEPQLAACQMNFEATPHFRQLNAGAHGRRRPSPGGVSGPV